MKIFSIPDDLKNERHKMSGTVGLVPTMGALHQGHLSLIKRSVLENDKTIVSIFVNPTQFLPDEDLESYPRRLESDLKLCRLAGVDVVFTPSPKDVYFENEATICAPSLLGFVLEGVRRPGHFDGVLHIVLKLLNLCAPNKAYFGKKDAQQLRLVQKMVKDLFLDTSIIPCDIVRDEKGLALSSRNRYLSENEYTEALKLSKSLELASRLISKGERNSKPIEDLMQKTLQPLYVEYTKVLSRDFAPLANIELGDTILAVCAYVGKTRLIDNIWI